MKESEWPLVSVITINYNGGQYIVKCLESVFKSRYPNFEVILVDNGSTDRSVEMAREFSKHQARFKIIENGANLGFSEGNNIGVASAKGRYLVFLGYDTVVDASWLVELVKIVKSDPFIGIAQSKLLKMSGERMFDSAGDFMDYCANGFSRGGCWGEKDAGQYDKVEEIFSARGAAMLVKREVLYQVGLFDSKFFMDFEDVDLSWRARLRGYRVVYVPCSVVYHKGYASATGFANYDRFRLYHSLKNRIAMLLKNYAFSNVIKFLTPRVMLTAISMTVDLVRIDIDTLVVKLRAFVWILRNLKYLLRQRSWTQYHLRKTRDDDVMKFMVRTDLRRFTWFTVELFMAKTQDQKMRIIREYFSIGFPSRHYTNYVMVLYPGKL